jgi:hypothetical protein
MQAGLLTNTASLKAALEAGGFAFVNGAAMREILAPFGSLDDWPAFIESWNHLELDRYMADGGRYRRRRHTVFADSADGSIRRQPHQPHIQSVEYNPLHGGIERWFEPIADEIAEGPTMRAVLRFCHSLFSTITRGARSTGSRARSQPVGRRAWHVEVHQFRIEACGDEQGRPTPEGLHRDGVDYVLVLLVTRQNIASGVTAIHALDGTRLGHFTLTNPLDAALVDDRLVAHGVTPVESIDSTVPAYRDVLVVTFRSKQINSEL